MATPRFLITSATAALVLQSFSFLNATEPASSNPFPLTLAAPASAAQTVYTPPLRPKPIFRTDSTGSRGCFQKDKPAQLSLLVPERHIGQTVSARPSFFWYLENAKVARFALVEFGVAKPLFEKTLQADKAGIMRVDLPQDAPELAVGKEYRWSVTVACNPNRPSDYVAFNQSFVERVAPSPGLSQQLARAKTTLERARAYAQNGLWYDALGSLSDASEKDPSARNEMLFMLDQVGLTRVTGFARRNDQAMKFR
ncbi:DUF928 domain-containing protein [Leptothermofonsia sichuanensis E412]|uniref:DUF928 domain-containing protein n=1 Tax=Leptothermofonsia sichuanensis TaxID=2917832 RepID=UPI001CA75EE3|nr:DUF928 domain-containing protein [Leptothermofonsia sichuanensis]QZZ20269.1 DUF928 domain-containing protein [Leptothermofonsia sichuanensis E412]